MSNLLVLKLEELARDFGDDVKLIPHELIDKVPAELVAEAKRVGLDIFGLGIRDLIQKLMTWAFDHIDLIFEIPPPAPRTGSAYVRLEYRRQMEIAVVGATAVVALEGSTVSDARIAITALAPTIRRAAEAESALAGSDGGETAVAAAARGAAAASTPISDVRASERYRRAMAEVIAWRAIGVALARARGEVVPVPASAVRP